MRFAHPEWLLCLIAIPLIALVAWLARRNRGERWKKLVANRLEHRLSHGGAPWAYFTSLALALLGLSGLIVAMAEPESGEEWITLDREGRNILFCVDISRSMLAEDIQPNRLQAARAAGLEILEKFPTDRVGVLLYAGENLIQCPLTLDHSFVEQTLAQLTPADIPYGGSNLTQAINDGVTLLTQSGQQSNVMVVFSDGENSSSGVEAAASNAASKGVFIYALGMGTSAGSFIPDPRERDGKFRDRRGNQVFSKLNEDALSLIASRTEGFYSRGIGGNFLSKLDSALEEMDRFQEEGKYQRVAKPAHQWFLFGGLLLLMISIFVRALPLRSAVAVEAAADSFSEALVSDAPILQNKAHYGLATSLFYLGAGEEHAERTKAWEGAEKHYEAALKIDPDDFKSAENLKQVQNYLEKKAGKEGSTDPNQEKNEEEPEKQEDKDGNQPPKDQPPSEEEKQEPKTDEGQGEDPKKENQNEESEEKKGEPNDQSSPPQDPQGSEQESENQQNEMSNEPADQNAENGKESHQNGDNPNQSPREASDQTPEDKSETSESRAEQENDKEAVPLNETREQRARRLLKQYADSGGKAPRRVRRPYNRSAQDW